MRLLNMLVDGLSEYIGINSLASSGEFANE
jgi:hypothetical protein